MKLLTVIISISYFIKNCFSQIEIPKTTNNIINFAPSTTKLKYYYDVSKGNTEDTLVSLSALNGTLSFYIKISHPNNSTTAYPLTTSESLNVKSGANLDYIIIKHDVFSGCKLESTPVLPEGQSIDENNCRLLITVEGINLGENTNWFNLQIVKSISLTANSARTVNTTTDQTFIYWYKFTPSLDTRTLTFSITDVDNFKPVEAYIYYNNTVIPTNNIFHYSITSRPLIKKIDLPSFNPYLGSTYNILITFDGSNKATILAETTSKFVRDITQSKVTCEAKELESSCLLYYKLSDTLLMPTTNLKDDFKYEFATLFNIFYGSLKNDSSNYKLVNPDSKSFKSYSLSTQSNVVNKEGAIGKFDNNKYFHILNFSKTVLNSELNSNAFIALEITLNPYSRVEFSMRDISVYSNVQSNNYIINNFMNSASFNLNSENILYNNIGTQISTSFQDISEGFNLTNDFSLKIKLLRTDPVVKTNQLRLRRNLDDKVNLYTTDSKHNQLKFLQEVTTNTETNTETNTNTDVETTETSATETTESTQVDTEEPQVLFDYPPLEVLITYNDNKELIKIANLTDTYYIVFSNIKNKFAETPNKITISTSRINSAISILLTKKFTEYSTTDEIYTTSVSSNNNKNISSIILNSQANNTVANNILAEKSKKFPLSDDISFPYILTHFKIEYNFTRWKISTSSDITTCPIRQYSQYYIQPDQANGIYSQPIVSKFDSFDISNKPLSLNRFNNVPLIIESNNMERNFLSVNQTYYLLMKTELQCTLNPDDLLKNLIFNVEVNDSPELKAPVDPNRKYYLRLFDNRTDSDVVYEILNKVASKYQANKEQLVYYYTDYLEIFKVNPTNLFTYFEVNSCNQEVGISLYRLKDDKDENDKNGYDKFYLNNNIKDDLVGYNMKGNAFKKMLSLNPSTKLRYIKIVKAFANDTWPESYISSVNIEDTSTEISQNATAEVETSTSTSTSTDGSNTNTNSDVTTTETTNTDTNTNTNNNTRRLITNGIEKQRFMQDNTGITATVEATDQTSTVTTSVDNTSNQYITSLTTNNENTNTPSSYIILKNEYTEDYVTLNSDYFQLNYTEKNQTIKISYPYVETEENSNNNSKDRFYFYFNSLVSSNGAISSGLLSSTCFFLNQLSSLNSTDLSNNTSTFVQDGRRHGYYDVSYLPESELQISALLIKSNGDMFTSTTPISANRVNFFQKQKGYQDKSYFYIVFFTTLIVLIVVIIVTIITAIKLNKQYSSPFIENEDEDIYMEITNKINY